MERVYTFAKADEEKLKSMLAYDPYTDPAVIPVAKKGDEQGRDQLIKENLEKLAQKDKYYDVIFARQEYSLREGGSMGMDDSKIFLYLKASEEFLTKAEEKLKSNFESFKHASPEDEQKVIKFIKEEQERSDAGFGLIFGGA
ncbi:MAG: hypothetical protein ACP5TL_00290 [Candidatus Micrarchaeia archaeon]